MTLPLADLVLILPELLIVGMACLILVLDPITPAHKKDLLAWMSLGILVVVSVVTVSGFGERVMAFSDLVVVDSYAVFWKMLLYLVSGLTILLSMGYLKEEKIQLAEYYAFVLLALTGMMVMVSGADLLTIYLGIELMSITLYIMAGFKRFELRSIESSAKYFVLGAFSSGILLYGISIIFGVTGSTRLVEIAAVVNGRGIDDPLVFISLMLLIVGFGFKVAAVPFHMWTPDVYEGAPTSVTAFMAVASKAASFAAFLRVLLEAFGGIKPDWNMLILVICIITVALGNLVAIVQTNVKRMLAYSSIAHAGYALIGVVVAGWAGSEGAVSSQGVSSLMLYLAIYSFMTIGAFSMVAILRKGGLEGEEIEDFTGLAKRHKGGAFLMLVFMVSLAGIPPTAGFIGKLYLFMAAVNAGLAWLAIIGLIFAAISAFFYLRIVMVMYMREPSSEQELHTRLVLSPQVSFVLACAVAGVVLLGIFPGPLVSVADLSSLSLK
ncbi:NADH-quinone oxidoreductase subunit N [Candidatus Nitrospira allomarina]|jgi:NADH-quinone oxidoreductase subunit N|uniref:NADH-quinone oxidoreductase subunit N n=1 Tax=Candidatus Nitrospira allomarina TaxID=3020900 RepID=A0AA96GJ01_9BACT|nr:NADH-quinone oxidoreductase subunit N [Candidatus Nitrospira allomarina]WNM59838.1 NADH-quinone oxidoreductase subunit N [Candidatus Nitrospira allomarina]